MKTRDMLAISGEPAIQEALGRNHRNLDVFERVATAVRASCTVLLPEHHTAEPLAISRMVLLAQLQDEDIGMVAPSKYLIETDQDLTLQHTLPLYVGL
uniref:Uncharacterized protein n=1 Tax=Sphaerodactylus townsendi TaxID=933632 RepID=A0ACB8GDD8_9SAUR